MVLRGMMEAQAENNDTYYPIAVAGINISKVLYEMFRSEGKGCYLLLVYTIHVDKQTMILFDHEHAVPEVRKGRKISEFSDLLHCFAIF
jgi:uncharacterized membrane protein